MPFLAKYAINAMSKSFILIIYNYILDILTKIGETNDQAQSKVQVFFNANALVD